MVSDWVYAASKTVRRFLGMHVWDGDIPADMPQSSWLTEWHKAFCLRCCTHLLTIDVRVYTSNWIVCVYYIYIHIHTRIHTYKHTSTYLDLPHSATASWLLAACIWTVILSFVVWHDSFPIHRLLHPWLSMLICWRGSLFLCWIA